MGQRSRVVIGVVLGLALCLSPPPARAQDFYFGFLIDNGWQGLFAKPASGLDQTLTSWATDQYFRAIVNGQKGGPLGTAFVRAWRKVVPDPFFAPIGPLAGLIVLDFGVFRGHLALIETPAGLQTSIAIIDASGNVDTRTIGTGLLGNGAIVGGGTANDLVVGGLIRFHAPVPVGPMSLSTVKHFPTVPFPSENQPMDSPGVSSLLALGSFYGEAQGPLRTYRRVDWQWTGLMEDIELLVANMQGSEYLVMACAQIGVPGSPPAHFLSRCTVSGTGPVLGAITGSLAGFSIGSLSSVFELELFLAP